MIPNITLPLFTKSENTPKKYHRTTDGILLGGNVIVLATYGNNIIRATTGLNQKAGGKNKTITGAPRLYKEFIIRNLQRMEKRKALRPVANLVRNKTIGKGFKIFGTVSAIVLAFGSVAKMFSNISLWRETDIPVPSFINKK